MMHDDISLHIATSAMLILGIGMAVVSFVPYPRVRLRSHSRRFFRIAGIGITLVSLMLLFA